MASDDARLAAAFWQAHRLAHGTREERLRAEANSNASDEVRDRISDDPAAGLLLLDALLAADEADPAFVGAGPLEDLLVEHGPLLAAEVAQRCAESSKWAEAVRNVWLDDAEGASVEPLQALLPPRE